VRGIITIFLCLQKMLLSIDIINPDAHDIRTNHALRAAIHMIHDLRCMMDDGTYQ
jgi:hypothetical protein